MKGIDARRKNELRDEFERVLTVLENCETVDKNLHVSTSEFRRRQKATYAALEKRGLDVGFVFSDEHYCGDVPYLGGNTNVTRTTYYMGASLSTVHDEGKGRNDM